MTRARRLTGAAAAGAALVTLAAPAAAQDPGPPVDVRGSIETLNVDGSIKTLEVKDSVEDLEVERQSGERVALTVAADVLFAFDRATLTPKADATIKRIADRLAKTRGPIRIDGYTDSVGSDAYNLALSRRRAAAVSQALAASLPSRRITARGHGEADPVAPNTDGSKDNPAGRAKNRRVTISYAR